MATAKGACPHRLRVWRNVGGGGHRARYAARSVPCKQTGAHEEHRNGSYAWH